VTRLLFALVNVTVVTGFALLLVTGRYVDEGSVLFAVSANHGIHEGDLFIGAGWALAVAAVGALVVRGRPRAERSSP
jgi:hypothetical protein